MLDYIALIMLIFVGLTLFYGIIALHDIPYEIAVAREHPQQDAIHVAGWVSLFTLHVIWPFLWIWAMLYKPERGWGLAQTHLENRIDELENRLKRFEQDQSQPHNPGEKK
jgi:hypothetical protein